MKRIRVTQKTLGATTRLYESYQKRLVKVWGELDTFQQKVKILWLALSH